MGSFRGGLLVRTRIGVLDRRARDPYALWDLYAASSRGRVRPFLQLANLTATSYEEIIGVAMPGRSIVGGIEWIVFGKR
jgi:iron complex outermembrane receptor protein